MKDIHIDTKALLAFFRRYHFVLFTVVVVLILSVAVLLLNGIVYKASGEESSPLSGASTNFDEDTIDRLRQLKTSDQPSEPLDLSQGRINPFGE